MFSRYLLICAAYPFRKIGENTKILGYLIEFRDNKLFDPINMVPFENDFAKAKEKLSVKTKLINLVIQTLFPLLFLLDREAFLPVPQVPI